MKHFSEQQVKDMIKLKFGQEVSDHHHLSYVSNKLLGKLFGCSGSKIRQLYMAHFAKIRAKNAPLLTRLRSHGAVQERAYYGYRFLKPHEIAWLTSSSTLRRQISVSIPMRCSHFMREFPGAHINPTLLREVYTRHFIKKKKLRWYKSPKHQDPDKQAQLLTTMKRQLTKARNDGYRLVYIDETCFTRKTVLDAEW